MFVTSHLIIPKCPEKRRVLAGGGARVTLTNSSTVPSDGRVQRRRWGAQVTGCSPDGVSEAAVLAMLTINVHNNPAERLSALCAGVIGYHGNEWWNPVFTADVNTTVVSNRMIARISSGSVFSGL